MKLYHATKSFKKFSIGTSWAAENLVVFIPSIAYFNTDGKKNIMIVFLLGCLFLNWNDKKYRGSCEDD